MTLPTSTVAAILLLLAAGSILPGSSLADPAAAVRQPFADRRNPPPWHALDAATEDAFDLGLLVFNTTWVPAGTANAARRDGIGPLHVLGSCDGCHNNGARGRGEPQGNRLPNSFVMQLGGPDTAYGAVINTQALPGYAPEGRIEVQWTPRSGRYPHGGEWQVREPRYRVVAPGYGPLSDDTVLRPRIAPAVFGAGLLQAVSPAAVQAIRGTQPRAQRGEMAWHEAEGLRLLGRFGWQADAVSIEDQTARALAREMGLTSRPRMQDDCTAAQWQCRDAPPGGTPEVSEEFLHALVTLQTEVAVPERPRDAAAEDVIGARLFRRTGCHICHREALPAEPGGTPLTLDAYTDLMLHDLGDGLADRTVDGRIVRSLWRTAPLWGMAHTLAGGDAAFMHDGRARSLEEAVLWHDGQARSARRAFEKLTSQERQALLKWVGSL